MDKITWNYLLVHFGYTVISNVLVVTPSLACLFVDYMHDENLNTISTFWILRRKRH